jgi:hypothetical protein
MYVQFFLMFLIFVLTLADGLRYAWFIYPILCWLWCLEIGTSSINWAQLSRFHLKTETEPSLQNVVLCFVYIPHLVLVLVPGDGD